MLAYSTQTIVDYLTHYTPLSGFNMGCDGAMGSTYVMVYGLGDSLGASYGFRVSNDLVAQHKKHAIVARVDVTAAPAC
jgi:hypothetical protein